MKFQKVRESQLKIINSIQEKYSQRYPNGGIIINKYIFDADAEMHDIIQIRKSDLEAFIKILNNDDFLKPLTLDKIERVNVDLIPRNFFLNLNGFSLVSRIAYNLMKGGNYSKYVSSSWSPKECLNIAIDFVEGLLHNEYDKIYCLYGEGVKWNTWFYEDYLSDTIILFDLKNKHMYCMLIRDSS